MILLQLQTDPITPEGAISAGWVLVGAFAVIGFLLAFIINNISKNNTSAMNALKDEIKNIHKRIDTREEEHDELATSHTNLSTRVLLVEAHHKLSAEKTADLIVTKLRAMGTRPPGFYNEENEE